MNQKSKLLRYFFIAIFASFLLIAQANLMPAISSTSASKITWERPFNKDSIWNIPIGSKAIYKSAKMEAGYKTSSDTELLFKVTNKDPLTRLYAPGSWVNRCSGTKSPTGNPNDKIYIRFPKNKIVPDATSSHTPNNVSSILQPDGKTIVAVAPLARCKANGPVYGWYFKKQSLFGKGITGGHGGSRLSGIGGTIRQGELIGDRPINHVLKVNLWGKKHLSYNKQDKTPGYRWPAKAADAYAAKRYGGSLPSFQMGALLAIPKQVTPESLNLKSKPALKLFYTLQNYGAYVVDDAAWNVTAFNLQEGVEQEFKQTYGYDFETNDRNSQWFKEYYSLIKSLHIITNNTPKSIGGGGDRNIVSR